MNKVIVVLVSVLSLGAISGCDKSGSPGSASKVFLPPAGFRGDAAKGRALYNANCSSCHGKSAVGSDKGPPLVHKVYEPSHHADLSFYRAASSGVKKHHWQFGDMPPVSGITPDQVAHIVAYVRKEQRAAGIF